MQPKAQLVVEKFQNKAWVTLIDNYEIWELVSLGHGAIPDDRGQLGKQILVDLQSCHVFLLFKTVQKLTTLITNFAHRNKAAPDVARGTGFDTSYANNAAKQLNALCKDENVEKIWETWKLSSISVL